jgi:hypothetical protein
MRSVEFDQSGQEDLQRFDVEISDESSLNENKVNLTICMR